MRPTIVGFLLSNYLIVISIVGALAVVLASGREQFAEYSAVLWELGVFASLIVADYFQDWMATFPRPVFMRYLLVAIDYTFHPAILLIIILPLVKDLKVQFVTTIPALVNAAFCMASAFGIPWVFTIDANNHFERGQLVMIPFATALMYAVIVVIELGVYYRVDRIRLAMIIFMWFSIVLAMMMQYANVSSNINEVIGIDLLLYTVYLIMDDRLHASEELAKKEIELQDSKVKLLVSQIQPHFIFNSLESIKALCREDPQKAGDAIQSFSRYLRANLESISSDKLISLETELNHARQYIALEQMGDSRRINVEWDIQDKNFAVPALTIEPLVENAIRHGIMARPGGGTIMISSRREGDYHIITVEDDGIGIDNSTQEQKNRKSTGMTNVRERLAARANGTLKVSGTGHGTLAVVRIPVEKED